MRAGADDSPVLVALSRELLEHLDEWSPPVHVRVERDPLGATGWTLIVRTVATEGEQ